MSIKSHLAYVLFAYTTLYTMEPTENVENLEMKPVKTYQDLVDNSNVFLQKNGRHNFPTENNLIQSITNKDKTKENIVLQQAQNTYTIVHVDTIQLINDFLAYKKEYGSTIEKKYIPI